MCDILYLNKTSNLISMSEVAVMMSFNFIIDVYIILTICLICSFCVIIVLGDAF